ncbi:AmmeMemoRadiSam system protein A [Candidatus Woesearchaeota archaeon]|nr:AmmeMemoRadiSam system protein A [Candidatus Woesearchaeota archaeon]
MKGELLISLARDAIKAHFSNEKLKISEELKSEFSDKQGVFVTLTIDGELRGCIGFIEAIYPLYESVIKAAESAAFSDPRFKPLNEAEFKRLKVEVSVLTKPELIAVGKPEDYVKKIKVGRDGLIVEKGMYKGLLLPQVATEYNWDSKEFLEYTCQKAGLNKDAWKKPGVKVYRFECEIFHE